MILGLLSFFEFVCFIGAGGILNELDSALEEIEKLEKNNNLENISSYNKFYLEEFHHSSELKQHISDYEKSLYYREIYFFILIVLFFFSLILRIYFMKRKRNEVQLSQVRKEK